MINLFKKSWYLIIAIILLIGGGLWLVQQNTNHTAVNGAGKVLSQGNGYENPTIFLHGFGGSANSTNYLIDSAAQSGQATRTLTATVSRNGKISYTGNWPKKAEHPMIQVVFENNQEGNYHIAAGWIHTLMTQLQQQYHIHGFNAVAHSWGNNAILYYASKYQQDQKLPKLNSLVTIAAPMSFPGKFPYQNRLKQDYSTYTGSKSPFKRSKIRVLNVYGNYQNKKSDSRVTFDAAQSLRQVFAHSDASYQELTVNGKNAQHSALTRSNPRVAKAMRNFLWKQHYFVDFRFQHDS